MSHTSTKNYHSHLYKKACLSVGRSVRPSVTQESNFWDGLNLNKISAALWNYAIKKTIQSRSPERIWCQTCFHTISRCMNDYRCRCSYSRLFNWPRVAVDLAEYVARWSVQRKPYFLRQWCMTALTGKIHANKSVPENQYRLRVWVRGVSSIAKVRSTDRPFILALLAMKRGQREIRMDGRFH